MSLLYHRLTHPSLHSRLQTTTGKKIMLALSKARDRVKHVGAKHACSYEHDRGGVRSAAPLVFGHFLLLFFANAKSHLNGRALVALRFSVDTAVRTVYSPLRFTSSSPLIVECLCICQLPYTLLYMRDTLFLPLFRPPGKQSAADKTERITVPYIYRAACGPSR